MIAGVGGGGRGLAVLTYHAFAARRSVTATEPTWLAETLAALTEAGYHGVDLADWVARGRPDEPRGFALAFDDGLASLLDVAETVAAYRVLATVFVVTGRVGLDNDWPGQPAFVPREGLLDWSELAALAPLGFSFGAHGRTHARLDRLGTEGLDDELRGARAAVEDKLGLPCPLLAYPYGAASRAVRAAAARHFSAAFGTRLDYAMASEESYDLSRIDAYYLGSRQALDALVADRCRGTLRLRRVSRALKSVGWVSAAPPTNLSTFVVGGAALTHPTSSGDGRRSSCPVLRDETLVCPECRAGLVASRHGAWECTACARIYPRVAGLLDLRLESDRYLSLRAERAKAERLHAVEPSTDVAGLASAYYDMTDDVIDRRRDRFLRHIAGAEARGGVLAARLPQGGRILEVGCGTGGLLAAAAKAGLAITGVDIAARWLVVARRRLNDRGLSVPLFAAQAERLPWPDATFDCVVADSLLEHLDDPARALREWARVLKPGGSLVVWSPNRFSLATDPHLGLWGVGWLPRDWVRPYLRLRGRTEWPPRTVSAWEAHRVTRDTGFGRVTVGPPEVCREWALTRPKAERGPLRAYAALRTLSAGRALLTAFGPLWELRAEAPARGAA